jgi:glycosyltransferase involved in cell wall biosynthesis
VRILSVEPPSPRRAGGIETALGGLTHALAQIGVEVTRSDMAKSARLETADVVHFHGLWEPSHLSLRRRCRELRKPHLVSPHGMLENWAFRHRGWKKRPYFYFFERRSVGGADAILATSEEETIPLRRWFEPDKIRVLPLGGDAPPSPQHATARSAVGLAADEFVVLFLSRCHQKKGLHLLIEALPAAVAPGVKVHLIVVGEGEAAYVGPLKRTTSTWKGDLHCTWVGAIWGVEKWKYLSAADLFCLPSYSENFGLAILEALFAGTPVLTTNKTPWASLRDTLPVQIIPTNLTELTRALAAALASPRATEAERAITRANTMARFSWSTLAPRYVELYQQLTHK